MTTDPSGPDPKSLWMEQDKEPDAVSLEQIHALIRRYDRRARRAVVAIPAILIAAGFVGGQLWIKAHDWIGYALALALVLGEAATFYIVWRMLYQPRDPAEPAGVYLHRKLLRRLDYLKGRWLLAAAPLLPALVLAQYVALAAGHRPLWLGLSPSLMVIACVAFIRLAGRGRQRRVRALIDELEALMGR